MSVDLNRPLAWTRASADAEAMLKGLQPNIVKEHVRDILRVLLLHFEDPRAARALLTHVAGLMKSAWEHLEEIDSYKKGGPPGAPYVGLGLTEAGYRGLGLGEGRIPDDPAFRRGAPADETCAILGDVPVSEWEPAYREQVHAVVLIGDAKASGDAVLACRESIVSHVGEGVTLLGEELGRGYNNESGHGIEHFGYVDGRSQPLFLEEEIVKERQHTDIFGWDPAFPLGQVLVRECGEDRRRFGSYLVLRKLEQDVRAFKEAEEALAKELKLQPADEERAGALVVGRFEDGTPVTVAGAEVGDDPVPNDFNYADDRFGHKCPLAAHIRLVNARDGDRGHIMPRRGQTYGERAKGFEDRPSEGVGLLFVAFNADIRAPFEYTQAKLANTYDPLIGQHERPPFHATTVWDAPPTSCVPPFPHTVRLRGAAYFFAPSLPFLRGLDANAM
jgi:deferrochelatase/peroxidase EfeB